MKSRIYRIGVLLVACFWSITATFAQQNKGIVSGVVTDEAGKPLDGVSVQIEGSNYRASTKSDGTYSFSLKPGSYSVRVSYVGYKNQSGSVSVSEGQKSTVDFKMSSGNTLAEVSVVGSRSKIERSVVNTPVPVDLISTADLKATAQPDLNGMIQNSIPAFTANKQTISDGTDHIDPASLRGLGPDQVLVLVDGKRRYSTALVNINQTFGRGAVGTDLNSIPASAIERVEVLRDGAASQYGSDAIAGVINIILKKSVNKGNLSVTGGQFYKEDGRTINTGLNFGTALFKDKGYLNVSADFVDRGYTNRVGTYSGTVYGGDAADVSPKGYDRNNTMRVGQAAAQTFDGAINMGYPVAKNLDAHFTAMGGVRTGESGAFNRFPNQSARTNLTLYPNGFLPLINSTILDMSFSGGLKGKVSDWDWDLTAGYGGNSFRFDISNTDNASAQALGTSNALASQTKFYAGTVKFYQLNTALDISRDFGKYLGLPSFNVAFGGAFRRDNFQQEAGEPGSYTNFSSPTVIKYETGSQGFTGYADYNAVNRYRNVLAGYLDIETDITRKWQVNLAGRIENYDSFGSVVAGKFSTRYSITDNFALRGAVSNGFRAPSLHQIYFSNTSSQFNASGDLILSGTYRNDSAIAKSFGIPELKAEKSMNYSLGTTLKLMDDLTITIDAYQIDIKDRIIVTGNFTKNDPTKAATPVGTKVDELLKDYPNTSAAAFFTNGVNTTTRGLDFVATHLLRFSGSSLETKVAFNYNKTTLDRKPLEDFFASNAANQVFNPQVVFNATEESRITTAVPQQKGSLTFTYKVGKLSANLRNTYYGEVTNTDFTEATGLANPTSLNTQTFDARVVTDLGLGYSINKTFSVKAGANNILDQYPEANNVGAGEAQGGRLVYSRRATQFGMNGGYWYVGLDLKF